jgi:ribosome-binding protein aMBF1 (putative translation factor)
MFQDIRDYDGAKRLIDAGEELVPSEVTYAILDGANPIKVWREHRGMARSQLADLVSMTEKHLTELEQDELGLDDETLESIARALGLSIEDMRTTQ